MPAQITFASRRVAYHCATLVCLLSPIHFLVPCQVSGAVGSSAAVLTVLTLILTFVDKGSDRLGPPLLATIGMLVHALFAH